MVHAIVPKTPVSTLVEALSRVQSPFGRGESLNVNGTPLELILVKNPDGFYQALTSFESSGCATMISVNDEYGDGRDIGWFYDVDFSSLASSGVAQLSGSRAYDMALRLEYDEVPLQAVEPDLTAALEAFLADSPEKPHRIFCSYTTMLVLRRLLGAKTEMERVI